jgi:hypothetical protein
VNHNGHLLSRSHGPTMPQTEGDPMYTLFRSVPMRDLLATQAPALFLSFVISELLYKFHSFTLECLAFLVTWFVIDAVITSVSQWFKRRSPASTGGES